jgi:hypothetical protein
MKTRNGFVSNSSSTSFVVVLPNIPLVFSSKKAQEAYKKLIADGEFREYKDYVGFQRLSSDLSKYVIASFEVDSDAGIIVVADKIKIRDILAPEFVVVG